MDKSLALLASGVRWDFETIYFDLSFCGLFEKIDTSQHRALSRTASSNNANHFPLVDIQINAFQYMQAIEKLMKVCEFDDRGLHSSWLTVYGEPGFKSTHQTGQ